MEKEIKRFRRVCRRCGELFVPTGRECRVCEDCKKEQWNKKRILK